MQISINGVWTEVPEGEAPRTVPWDASLPFTGYGRLGDNAGCPEGYFCEYVSGAFGGTEKVCRRLDMQIASNPAVLQAETGPGLYEQTQINVAAAAESVVSGAGAVLGFSLPYLLIFGGVLWFALASKYRP